MLKGKNIISTLMTETNVYDIKTAVSVLYMIIHLVYR